MDGHKYTFMPSSDERTHVDFDDPDLLVGAVMEHLQHLHENCPPGVRLNISMRDADFGPDEQHMWNGLVIMYHRDINDDKAVRAGGIPVGFIRGIDTLEFIKHCPVQPDAWCRGDEAFQPYERPQGRLH